MNNIIIIIRPEYVFTASLVIFSAEQKDKWIGYIWYNVQFKLLVQYYQGSLRAAQISSGQLRLAQVNLGIQKCK